MQWEEGLGGWASKCKGLVCGRSKPRLAEGVRESHVALLDHHPFPGSISGKGPGFLNYWVKQILFTSPPSVFTGCLIYPPVIFPLRQHSIVSTLDGVRNYTGLYIIVSASAYSVSTADLHSICCHSVLSL